MKTEEQILIERLEVEILAAFTEDIKTLANEFTKNYNDKKDHMGYSGWYTMAQALEVSIKIRGNKERGIIIEAK